MKRILSLFLCLSLSLSFVITASATNSNDVLVLSEDFESFDGSSLSGWYIGASSKTVASGYNSSKAFEFTTNGSYTNSLAISRAISSADTTKGEIEVKFNAKICSNAQVAFVAGNSNWSQRPAFIISRSEYNNSWHEYTATYDLGTRKMVLYIDGNLISSGELPVNMGIKQFMFTTYTADASGTVDIDNFSVKLFKRNIKVTTTGAVDIGYDLFGIDGLNYYTISYENLSDYVRNVTMSCVISDDSKTYNSKTVTKTISPGESALVNVGINMTSFGEANCSVTVNDGTSENTVNRRLLLRNTFTAEDTVNNSDLGVMTKMGENRSGGSRIFGAVKASGSGIVREFVGWNYFETTKGTIKPYANLDSAVELAKQNGVDMVMCFATGNSLYEAASRISSNTNISKFAMPYPDSLDSVQNEYNAAFMNLISYVVNRYKDTVHYWEIWNEPNLYTFNKNASPEQYARLLKQATELIHSIDSTATVLGMDVAGAGRETSYSTPTAENPNVGAATWIEKACDELIKLGGIDKGMDALSIHLYYQSEIPFQYYITRPDYLRGLKNVMDEKDILTMPVWITETGAYTGSSDSAVSELDQARRIIMTKPAFDYFMAKNGMTAGKVILYDLQDDGTDATYSENNFGLMSYSLMPKTSYNALAVTNKVLSGKKLVWYTDKSPWIMRYNSKDGEGYYIGADANNTSFTITLRGDKYEIYNIEGELIEAEDIENDYILYTGTVGTSPILIKTSFDKPVSAGFESVNAELKENSKITASGRIEGYEVLNQTVKCGLIKSDDDTAYNYSNVSDSLYCYEAVTCDETGYFEYEADITKIKRGKYKAVFVLPDNTVYTTTEYVTGVACTFNNVTVNDYSVEVFGTGPANSEVIISVVPKSIDIESLSADTLSYIQSTNTDSSGNFSFSFKAGSGMAKEYTIYLSSGKTYTSTYNVLIGSNEAASWRTFLNDVEVNNTSDAKEGDSIKLECTYYGDSQDAVLIGAEVSDNGLKIIKTENFTKNSDGNRVAEIVIPVEAGASRIDAYLWKNFGSLEPLCNKKIIK